jgi:hypothetical protein
MTVRGQRTCGLAGSVMVAEDRAETPSMMRIFLTAASSCIGTRPLSMQDPVHG